MSHYHYDCEEYCDQCASPGAYLDDGEQDTPANCAGCGRPLDYSLTADGVKYVLEYIMGALETGIEDDHIIPLKGTAEEEMLDYYQGSPHYEIVRDWAKDLQDYSLDRKDACIVQAYLTACDYADAEPIAPPA